MLLEAGLTAASVDIARLVKKAIYNGISKVIPLANVPKVGILLPGTWKQLKYTMLNSVKS